MFQHLTDMKDIADECKRDTLPEKMQNAKGEFKVAIFIRGGLTARQGVVV